MGNHARSSCGKTLYRTDWGRILAPHPPPTPPPPTLIRAGGLRPGREYEQEAVYRRLDQWAVMGAGAAEGVDRANRLGTRPRTIAPATVFGEDQPPA